MQFTREEITDAARLVYRHMQATPQYAWPLLCERVGTPVWVKHENHTPTGAFKVRGGITLIDWLARNQPNLPGLVSATRGNHGQSLARAAAARGIPLTIVVPHGNSLEKNAAMKALGARLIEEGRDFGEACEVADRLASDEGLYRVPAFHPELVRGVATYALELFEAVPDLHRVYVPVGCGSGICGVIAARDALGLDTEIIGVVSTEADGAKRSFEAGRLISTESAETIADGLAVRTPVADALTIYSAGAKRMVAVSDAEIREAMRIYHHDTHNLAEGAGAAALAALLQEREQVKGMNVAVILSGSNVDYPLYTQV